MPDLVGVISSDEEVIKTIKSIEKGNPVIKEEFFKDGEEHRERYSFFFDSGEDISNRLDVSEMKVVILDLDTAFFSDIVVILENKKKTRIIALSEKPYPELRKGVLKPYLGLINDFYQKPVSAYCLEEDGLKMLYRRFFKWLN